MTDSTPTAPVGQARVRTRRRPSGDPGGVAQRAARAAPAEEGQDSPAPVRQRRRALDLTTQEGTTLVERTDYHCGRPVADPVVTRETIRVPVFHTAPAYVGAKGSVTRNLGDYNSVRVEVSVSVPCYPVEEEIQRAYEYVTGKLDELIPEQLAKATGGDQG